MNEPVTRTEFPSFVASTSQTATTASLSEHDLLHRRLRRLCILGIGGWPLVYLVLFGGLDPVFGSMPLDWGCGISILVTAAAPLIYALVLIAFTQVSAGFLRFVELSLLGLCTVCLAWMRHTTIDTSLATMDNFTGEAGPLYASAFNNLVLLCVVVAFGVVVNPWKRTLTIVLVVSVLPLLFEGAAWLRHFPSGFTYLASSLVMTGLAVFIGGGVTVFGSYRLERLQGQVSEAQRLLSEFGQYKLMRRIGHGAMGDVHLAEHRLLKRPCAIKFIRNELVGKSQAQSRFDREVKAMTRLTHWNVVEIYDYGRMEDGTFYYVMEYVPGLNLNELVRKHGPLPPARAIHILKQICAGLREAHAVGLVHRDIKPSNVIVGERGGVFDTVKLLDFGLVQNEVTEGQDDRITQTGAIVGTAAFMSPEQAMGTKRLTHHTDLYSLGGLGYCLLTGQAPFVRPSPVQTIHAHIADPVIPPGVLCAGVPADLEQVILKCLKKAPEERYPDAEALESALRSCSDGNTWTQHDARSWWGVNREALEAPCSGEGGSPSG